MTQEPKTLFEARARFLQRRWFMRECGVGLAGIAATQLMQADRAALGGGVVGEEGSVRTGPLAPKSPHFPGKIKRVVYMFQAGAPSQLRVSSRSGRPTVPDSGPRPG